MNELRIDVDGGTAHEPGGEVAGTLSWTLDGDPDAVHVRLFWYTEGKGDRDLSVVEEVVAEAPAVSGRLPFRFRLPAGPYGFSGTLISLTWALEAVADPSGAAARVELAVGPGGREARIDGGAGEV
jgi:hypothetical protein